MRNVMVERANSIISTLKKSERVLTRELQEVSSQAENISQVRTGARKRAKESLERLPEEQRQVFERIESLRLRLELLRNIKMNWEQVTGNPRFGSLRINQLEGLHQLISFLSDESYSLIEGNDCDPGSDENENDETPKLSRDSLRGHYVQPTGSGKTVLFAIEAALMNTNTLVLVPFDNLLQQTKKVFAQVGILESDIGIVGGRLKEMGRKFTIATYAGHRQLMNRNTDYAKKMQEDCKLVICDELHMALGKATQGSIESIDGNGDGQMPNEEKQDREAEEEVLEHLSALSSKRSVKIGFTATPRLSANHVRKFFPRMIGRVYHAEMVEHGILVPYKIVQCDGSVFVGEIEDYISQKQEVEILEREGTYSKLVGDYYAELVHYREQKGRSDAFPLRGMAFCTNRAECHKLLKEAEGHGLRCEVITAVETRGKAGSNVIDNAIARMKAGELDLIITVEKLCAGFDFPEINGIIWARVTSAAKTIQGIGRGARSCVDEQGKAKTDCYVFETDWSLKDNAKKGKKPLRLADALIQQGEDPDRICTMANGGDLQYEDPKRILKKWHQRYQELHAWRALHPDRWPSQKQPNEQGLADWLKSQRASLRDGNLSQAQKEKLVALNVEAAKSREQPSKTWDKWHELFSKWREINPNKWPSTKTDDNNECGLAKWMYNERIALRDGQRSRDQMEKLTALGVLPAAARARGTDRKNWKERYEQLLIWRSSQPDRWPSQSSKEKDEKSLAAWLSEQRIKLREQTLSVDEADKLVSLGVQEAPIQEKGQKTWNERYSELATWLREHPDLLPSIIAQDEDEQKIARWMYKQKEKLRDGKLSREEERELKTLGIEAGGTREEKRKTWKERYEELTTWQAKHTDQLPNQRSENVTERSIAKWLYKQIAALRENKLNKDQTDKLSKLGIT